MIKLFQLKPLGEFFFGGEATFGPGDNRHYFVRSNLLPQQTSLLGLLRHELLKSDPSVFDLVADRIINPAAAAKLVGSQGFDGITDAPFGIIEGLSPIFLLDQNGTPFFLQARLALKQRERTWLEKKSSAEPRFRSESLLATASAKTTGYQLMTEKLKKGRLVAESYDGKAEFQEMLVGADGRQVSLRYDPDEAPEGVFIKIEKTGNRKDYEGASDESGFFKQHMFKLRSGWRFSPLSMRPCPPTSARNTKLTSGPNGDLFCCMSATPTRYWQSVAAAIQTAHWRSRLLPKILFSILKICMAASVRPRPGCAR